MEETIELREIIEIILKGKWLISICTIVAMLFAFIVSWFVLDEQYESKAVVQIASSVQDTGIMANYVAAEFTPTIYMQRIQNETVLNDMFTKEGIGNFSKANLTATNTPSTQLVEVAYKSNSAEEAQKHLQLVLSEAKNQMNASVKENLKQLEATYLNEANSLTSEIEGLMNKYNSIVTTNNLPEILILQTITTSEFVINLNAEQTSTLAEINGALQNELLQLGAQIKVKSEEYHKVLANYQSVKTGLDSFKPDPFIRTIVEPTLAGGPSSPTKVLNLAIGLILGLMVGIGLVFFRSYWKSTAK